MQDIAILLVAVFLSLFVIALVVFGLLEARTYWNWTRNGTPSGERPKAIRQAIRSAVWTSFLTGLIAMILLASTGILASILKAWLDNVLR